MKQQECRQYAYSTRTPAWLLASAESSTTPEGLPSETRHFKPEGCLQDAYDVIQVRCENTSVGHWRPGGQAGNGDVRVEVRPRKRDIYQDLAHELVKRVSRQDLSNACARRLATDKPAVSRGLCDASSASHRLCHRAPGWKSTCNRADFARSGSDPCASKASMLSNSLAAS